jgi:hypothetical protein
LVARDPKDVETVLDNIDRGVHLFW